MNGRLEAVERRSESVGNGHGGSATESWSGEDPRIIEALEAYLEVVEAGEPPRLRDFIERYPEIAEGLERCLTGMEAIRAVAPQFRDETSDSETTGEVEIGFQAALPQTLGDYRLDRELGRGGMGVVFEAWQASLQRRVAVKVLPFAATLDPRQLQRFRTEAQAAACLQHENIVPIYAVGFERGVHYYVMRYIEGRPLSSEIAQNRLEDGTPEPVGPPNGPATAEANARLPEGSASKRAAAGLRRAARLGLQAARALEHAHSLGILHRDIKPANLLVDDTDHLWITDFGLARIQAAQATVTGSGDLLGTLRYMSPEQALARHSAIDHRSDLYSLGATLYEHLTGEPLVEGADNHDLIQRIAHEPPRPLRRLRPEIPRDLETIVLKCLAKEPRERYASAQELAEDLERFLEDRPILARRPTLAERSARWARRHKPVVATAAVLMVIALIAQSASIMMLAIQRNRAEAFARQSMERSRHLFETADSLYQRFAERLGSDPNTVELQRELFENALGIYEQFAKDYRDDPTMAAQVASAFRKSGDIHLRLGHYSQAELAYTRALERLKTFETPPPTEDGFHERAHVLNRLGRVFAHAAEYDRASWYHEEAVHEQERWTLVDNRIGPRLDLITYYRDLGRLKLTLGQPVQAERAHRRALQLTQELIGRAEDSSAPPGARDEIQALQAMIVGRLLRTQQAWSDAEARYRDAVTLYERLIEDNPDHAEYRRRATEAALSLAWFLTTCPDPAIQNRDEAARIVNQAINDEPTDVTLYVQASHFFMFLGGEHYRTAERYLRDALQRAPDRADVNNNLAWLLTTSPFPNQRNAAEALRLAEEAVKHAPGVGIYWNTLGVAHYRLGHYREAVAMLEKSCGLRGDGDAFDWFFLAMARYKLGDRETASQLYEAGVRWMKDRESFNEELKRFRDEARQMLLQA